MTDQAEDQATGVEAQTDDVSLKEQSTALLDRLVDTYPTVFFPFTARQVKPLKIGIHKDLEPTIKAWGFPPAALKIALSRYTRARRYQVALLKEPQRLDLQGEAAGEVSDENRQIAQGRIDEFNEKRKQQQAAIKAAKAAKSASQGASEGQRPAPGGRNRSRNEPRKPQRGRKGRDPRLARPGTNPAAEQPAEAQTSAPAAATSSQAAAPAPSPSRPPRNKKPSGPREPSAEKLAALAAKFNSR